MSIFWWVVFYLVIGVVYQRQLYLQLFEISNPYDALDDLPKRIFAFSLWPLCLVTMIMGGWIDHTDPWPLPHEKYGRYRETLGSVRNFVFWVFVGENR